MDIFFASTERDVEIMETLTKLKRLKSKPERFDFVCDQVLMSSKKHVLGGGSNMFYVHHYLGKIPILTNIFQRGWNHELVVAPGCISSG